MLGARRVARAAKRLFHGPRIRAASGSGVMRLGSAYGGWHFLPLTSLEGGTVLSCGLGEDASFDVELAARFHCRIVIVDPTPRAVEHFRLMDQRYGQRSEFPYADGGRQDVRSYDMADVSPEQLVLVDKALADECGSVRFYAPKSADDVSHSIVNFQHGYSKDTPFIEVEAIDVLTLLNQQGVNELALAKFDIEGAEILVLPQLLASGVLPQQLLVEFDELNWPSRQSREKFMSVHGKVLAAGYEVTYFDGRSCVSYARS